MHAVVVYKEELHILTIQYLVPTDKTNAKWYIEDLLDVGVVPRPW